MELAELQAERRERRRRKVLEQQRARQQGQQVSLAPRPATLGEKLRAQFSDRLDKVRDYCEQYQQGRRRGVEFGGVSVKSFSLGEPKP